jgi:sterol desaturase/sphingolipid hydroxylase (fatty acid hydroxylase superfamily)
MPENKINPMFQNRVFDYLSRSNPASILFIHLILILSMLIFGVKEFQIDFLSGVSVFVLGVISWTLAEYLIHRFLFHWTGKNSKLRIVHYALHGHHHQNPTDKNHLFMPPVPVVLIVFLLFFLFYSMMEKFTYFFFPGFEMGYLIYSMIHYSLHIKPYSRGLMKKLWIHHGRHHYENSSLGYGVSNTFWDHIFRTTHKEKENS